MNVSNNLIKATSSITPLVLVVVGVFITDAVLDVALLVNKSSISGPETHHNVPALATCETRRRTSSSQTLFS